MSGSERYPPVLVVDDDPQVVELLAEWIAERGWSVQTCRSGMQALEILDGWTRGVVLADLQMPGLDGLALCRALRDPSRLWTPFFILLTGVTTSPRFIESAFEQGIDDFIRKPIQREELLGRLRAALRMDTIAEDLRVRSEIEIERRMHQAGVDELREVVATLAHDLRTPIAALRTTAEMLGWDVSDDQPALKTGLERMVKIVVHLSETVTDVADAFQCEDADQLRESWREFDLGLECAHACDLVRSKVPPHVLLEAPAHRGVAMVGNPAGIRRMLVNLLSNALRVVKQGSIRVDVQMAPDPGHVLVSVRDTGPGIPAEILPHLGEPMMLSSGSSRRDRSIHGAGMGLPICRRIVATHGGRMFVETSPGRGTTVLVRLKQELSGPMLGSGHCPLDREIVE